MELSLVEGSIETDRHVLSQLTHDESELIELLETGAAAKRHIEVLLHVLDTTAFLYETTRLVSGSQQHRSRFDSVRHAPFKLRI
jgi:hypothetical protein